MIGDGCCAFVSICLGKGEAATAKKSVGNSFVITVVSGIVLTAINNMLRKYGALDAIFGQEQYAQITMAVVGIVMKFFRIVISIVVGMAAGCIPIVGFNIGAEMRRK